MKNLFTKYHPNLNNKSILITGGTGSFGKHFVKKIITNYKPKRLVIFSRDELKQYDMSNDINEKKNSFVRFFLGDLRDKDRLKTAFKDIDIVIHAAALKQVESSEYNPYECIKTNIIGSQNVITASFENGIKKVIFISTDKAANPINLYGATKLAAEKLFIAANNIKGKNETNFSVVRYGNVIGSRGSVIPFFINCKKQKKKFAPITHRDMTRFLISLDNGVNFVLSSLGLMNGGEIFVPKIPSVRIVDLAKLILPNHKIKIIGIRKGEKLDEVLISKDESSQLFESDDRYIIEPMLPFFKKKFDRRLNLKKVIKQFQYSSDLKPFLLEADQIQKNLDIKF
jgi:UDP-N-acetylglucosamine 4,6-dehydratase